MSRKAVLIGASGLIGSNLTRLLIENTEYTEVVLIVRKPLPLNSPKVKQEVVNFDDPESYAEYLTGDVIFSCLGTTRKKTPDAADYRKVDLTYPLQAANAGLRNGVKQFHIVSSLGANSRSSSSYLKLKGELEDELRKLHFKSLHIYQPSYIIGDRAEKRTDDSIMKPIMRILDPLFFGPLKKYKSIEARDIASAMLKQSLKDSEGTFIYPSNIIKELA